jgi:uncharacterized protein (TIGR03066 family)
MLFRITAGLLLLLFAFACNEDEKEFAPIVGKWKGTLAEVEVKPFGIPIPVSKEDDSFDSEIEFKSDGTLIVIDNSQTTEGTWQLKGDKLTSDINLGTDLINISGTYTIEILTQTSLVFYLEKQNEKFTDPDSGQTISGDFKGILHFQRI